MVTTILEIVLQVIRHMLQLKFKGDNHLKETTIGKCFTKLGVPQNFVQQYCRNALVLRILETSHEGVQFRKSCRPATCNFAKNELLNEYFFFFFFED